jgi:hypothetical protein
MKQEYFMEDRVCSGLTINRPAWFQDEGFVRYLNSQRTMTWHNSGMAPDEWSDVVVLVDPSCSGEGPDSDEIPSEIWREIVDTCRQRLGVNSNVPHYLVRITNIDSNERGGPGHWGEDRDYPVADWQYAVANGDTRLGYWPWVTAERSSLVGE